MGTRRYQRGRFTSTNSSKRAPSVAGNGVSQHAHEIARPSFIWDSTITILYSAPQLEQLNSIGPSFFVFTHVVSYFASSEQSGRQQQIPTLRKYAPGRAPLRAMPAPGPEYITVLRQKLAPIGQRFVFIRQSTLDVPRTAHLRWRRVEQRS
jgi:hypothetical protein